MNSFEARGEAQLLAIEGQRQIGAALARLAKTAFSHIRERLFRSSPVKRTS